MVPHLFCLLIVPALVTGCRKTGVEPEPDPPPQTFYVVEAVSRKPIEGAKVSVYVCTKVDWFLGCTSSTSVYEARTNKEGKISVPGTVDIDHYRIVHPNYWSGYAEYAADSCKLLPVSTIRTSIKKKQNHTAPDQLSVTVNYADCFSPECIRFTNYYLGLPTDTTVYLKGFGFSNNHVSWTIRSSTPASLPDFYISGFDTANALIEY